MWVYVADLCMTLKDLRDTTQKCNKPYSLLDEDEEDYAIKWKPIQVSDVITKYRCDMSE